MKFSMKILALNFLLPPSAFRPPTFFFQPAIYSQLISRYINNIILAVLLLLIPAAALAQSASAPDYYIPYHIYDTQTRQWIDLETMLAAVTQNDILFIGEQHDDELGHHLELAIVEGATRRRNIAIGMEMFERDVQSALDDYLAGRINEVEFLARARPWPNYQSDYRPIIEFARSHKLTVIGSNAPQRLARAIATHGIGILDRFPMPERNLVAQECQCPHDDYWQRFSQTLMAMSAAHGGGQENPHNNPHESAGNSSATPANPSDRFERFYEAQCLKDETMAESIISYLKALPANRPLFIHINGDFHSDYAEGTNARAHRRDPAARIQNISIIPVENLDKINADEYAKQGTYLIFTLSPPEKR
jgi:uncharacterized iron-regulated protein